VGAAQYPIERLADAASWRRKVTRMVEEAAARARLLVFPEYMPVELMSLHLEGDLHAQIRALQAHLGMVLDTLRDLACRHQVVIVGGSFPQHVEDGTLRNRSYVFGAAGQMAFQEKLHMTRWEDEAWGISAGREVRVIHTDAVTFGVNVCLDVEFAAQARRQAEAGAMLIAVPSATDTLHGWNRVRTGCLARALENQCFVIMSSIVGTADWSPLLDSNVGAAGVFAPMDEGFPADGVLAKGTLNEAGWVYADLDFARLRAVRETGEVSTFRKGGDAIEILQGPVEDVPW